MSRRNENSYEDLANSASTWRDKLTDQHTFQDWQQHKHQIRTMLNTSSSEPMPLHRFEVESNGRTVESESGRYTSITYDNPHALPRPPHSAKSDTKKETRVNKRVLYGLLGVIGIIAIAIPIIVVMLLRESDGGAPEAKVGTLDLEVTVQNLQLTEALSDPESDEYRTFTTQFCQEMETLYRASSIGDKYNGCLVQELRQGSIIVVFTLVFYSTYLPANTAVRKVFTDNATPTTTGALTVTVGLYIIPYAESTVVVGSVTIIDNDKNPTPRIGYGQPCTVDKACSTYRAICVNRKCGCHQSRRYSSSSDKCILLPTTTMSTQMTASTSTSLTTSQQQITTATPTTKITNSTTTSGLTTDTTTTPTVSTQQTTVLTTAQTTSSESTTATPSLSTQQTTVSTSAQTTSSEPTTSTSTEKTPTTSESTSPTSTKAVTTTATQTTTSLVTETAATSTNITSSEVPSPTTELTSSTTNGTSTETGTPTQSTKLTTAVSTSQPTTESKISSTQTKTETTVSASKSTSESTSSSTKSTSDSTTSEQTSSTTKSTPHPLTSSPQSTSDTMTSTPKTSTESTLLTSTSEPPTSSEILTTTTPTASITTSTIYTTPTSATVSITSPTSTHSSTTSSPSSSSTSTTTSPTTTSTSTSISTSAPPTTAIPTSTASTTPSSTSTITSPSSTSSSKTITSTSTVTTASTSASTLSSSLSQSTSIPTSTLSTETPSVSPSSSSTSTPTTQTPSTDTSPAVTSDLTSPSTQLTPQTTSQGTTTPTQESTTQQTLEFIPSITLLSPLSRRLDIGVEGKLVYQIDNATDRFVVTINKTTPDNDTPLFIGDYTFQNGTDNIGAYYGDNIADVDIGILSSDPSVSFELTVTFITVKCNDSGTYHCSVTLPNYSNDPVVEVPEDIEAYKMRQIQLNFPHEHREGLWGLDIGCDATLRANETLSLMRKLPGESNFTVFVPQVQKEVELRRNETVDPDFPCIKEATYYFDIELEGWNRTEIRCAINANTDEEVLSDIGVFQVVPRSTCDGKEANVNVPNPLDCKLYVTCSADATFWGYVHRSNCPDGECWLSNGLCGTTTTVTTIPTTPTTTTTPTTLPPHLPSITCFALKMSAYTGGDVNYICALRNVDVITQVNLDSNQITFEQTDEAGLSGTYTDGPVTVTVDMDADNQTNITIASVTCDMEGDVTITMNGNLSDTVSLRIIGVPENPQLTMPENIYENQAMTLTCSGNVGRNEDGSPVATLGFEALQEGSNETVNISGPSVQVTSNTTDNCENHISIQYEIVAMDMMKGAIFSCVSSANADQSELFKESSAPIEILEANIFFDKDGIEHKVTLGDTLSLACSFQNLQNVDKLTVTRGQAKDVVLILHRNGTIDQLLNHFMLTSSDWGDDSGSVTIAANASCSDGDGYYCETDSEVGEAFLLITVNTRPETPTLTLSYELIEGQVSWADRLSECKAQIGDPAGQLVVEILVGDTFQELEIQIGSDYPKNTSLKCGMEQTIKFYFNDLTGLNNSEIRCAVKPADVFNDMEKVVSESQTVQTVDGSYCAGINTSFYPHPYDCHYYTNCPADGAGDFHFTRCNNPDFCPNIDLKICDIDSCAALCNRGPKPYLRCGQTIEAEFDHQVTITCEMGNLDGITLENIVVLQDNIILLNETWESGTVSTTDGSIMLTYTAEAVTLDIAQMHCQQDAVYTILVNGLLSDTTKVFIKTNATAPMISSTRFVDGQLASIICTGDIGNPSEATQMFIEYWVKDGPNKTDDFEPVTPSTDVTDFNSTSCSYEKTLTFITEIMAMMSGLVEFRCRTSSDFGNLTSDVIDVIVEPQEIDIQPASSNVSVGDVLLIECTVTGVSELTFIKFYRESDPTRTVCEVTSVSIVNSETGISCSGDVSETGGRLEMKFASVQCSHEDIYVCECNPEASTRKKTALSISNSAEKPGFTELPKTLVENKALLDAESFTCEANMGYPSTGNLVIQTNKNGDFKTYDDAFGVERTFLEENCTNIHTLKVGHYTFDSLWNNTALRCAIADVNGDITTYVSEEIQVKLIPATFCDGQSEYNYHPYDAHLYIRCTVVGLFVYSCKIDECPFITNGTNVHCGTCN